MRQKTKWNNRNKAEGLEKYTSNERENTDEYKKGDEITPSPIISRPTMEKMQSVDLGKKHSDLCGCHDCFLDLCSENKNINKDSVIVLIRNFIKYRKETTDLKLHKKGCMCVNHLKYYKENRIHILDTFLETLNTSEKKNNNTSKPHNSTKTETNIEQHKFALNYNKLSKSTSSINHKNLTTLT